MAIFVQNSFYFHSQLASALRQLRLLKMMYNIKRSWDKRTQSIKVRPKRMLRIRLFTASDFIHSAPVTIPLHQEATIPKAKQQEIDRVKATDRFLTPSIDNTPDILSKIHKLCPVHVPCQSKADSDGTRPERAVPARVSNLTLVHRGHTYEVTNRTP